MVTKSNICNRQPLHGYFKSTLGLGTMSNETTIALNATVCPSLTA